MGENKIRNTLVKGAFILTISNALVKVLSALYIIPLTNLIGEEGMGYLNSAFTFYTIMFILATAGLPVAISRMIATSTALGRYKEINKILKVSLLVYLSVSFLVALLMLLFAKNLSLFLGNPSATLSFIVIAPSIVLITLTSALKGYFQGQNDMVPTAVSNLIEALFKCIFGILIAYYLLSIGCPLPIVAAGAIGGVSIGALLCGAYIIPLFLIRRKKLGPRLYLKSLPSRPFKVILKEFLKLAIPTMIAALSLNMTNAIDLIVIMKRLVQSGLSGEEANRLYGAYSSMVLTFFNMPTLIILAIATTILPSIAGAFAVKNKPKIKATIRYTYKITTIIALPLALGMSIMARPILEMLFSARMSGVLVAAPLLQIIGFAVFPLCIASVTNSMLLAIGKPSITVYNILIGGAVKLLVNFILVGIPSVRMLGAPIGTALCYFIIMLFNFYHIKKHTGVFLKVYEDFIKPFVCTIGCCTTAFFSQIYLKNLLGFRISLLLAIAFSAIIYVVLLFLTGSLAKNDVFVQKFGKKLAKILEKKGQIV